VKAFLAADSADFPRYYSDSTWGFGYLSSLNIDLAFGSFPHIWLLQYSLQEYNDHLDDLPDRNHNFV
ncbi:hypothetical protein A2U01_0013117, partial [Trifolium medium]|nr:hypothetical protein [Trifolium medium]